MDKKDIIIKNKLAHQQTPLKDSGFTSRIVSMYSQRMQQKSLIHQIDLTSLMIGILAVLVSLLFSYANALLNFGLTEEQVGIVQAMPVLYLLFQALSEYLNPRNHSRKFSKLSVKTSFIILLLMTAYLA